MYIKRSHPGSPVSLRSHVAVKLFVCFNDIGKSLETPGTWACIRNAMSIIGCKQDNKFAC
ncbi:hypothetical protein EYF80_035977 [Liparis tanakae]|uniref:Uncharacterized protein n=1 Tax=Liparis tanakae TaxID=230148 RepID=A0A4Z2GME1_9TELE|nr:hypothetical protein EYF80_035977 [Liparis tanakae]